MCEWCGDIFHQILIISGDVKSFVGLPLWFPHSQVSLKKGDDSQESDAFWSEWGCGGSKGRVGVVPEDLVMGCDGPCEGSLIWVCALIVETPIEGSKYSW